MLIGVLALAAGSARAANVQLFAVPTAGAGLSNIVAGPDGALWFNEQNGFAVGRITTAGAVTEFPVPRASYSANGDGPTTIVSSGGNLWTLANVGSTIDAISTAGAVTQLYGNLNQSATNLAPDSAGGVWATSLAGAGGGSVSGGLFRVDPPSGAVRNYRNPQFIGQFQPVPIVAGPNGTAWFADGGAAIREINNAGKITAIPIRGSGSMVVTSLAFDRKGDLWFTEYVPAAASSPRPRARSARSRGQHDGDADPAARERDPRRDGPRLRRRHLVHLTRGGSAGWRPRPARCSWSSSAPSITRRRSRSGPIATSGSSIRRPATSASCSSLARRSGPGRRCPRPSSGSAGRPRDGCRRSAAARHLSAVGARPVRGDRDADRRDRAPAQARAQARTAADRARHGDRDARKRGTAKLTIRLSPAVAARWPPTAAPRCR